MSDGDIFCQLIPVDLDYLAPADTELTFVDAGGFFDPFFADNITYTIVDVSGRNSVRKVVILGMLREPDMV